MSVPITTARSNSASKFSPPPPLTRIASAPATFERSPFRITAPRESEAHEEERSQSHVDNGEKAQVVDWDGPDDPHNPQNFSRTRKWILTIVGIFGTLILPLNGTSIAVAARQINAQFGVSDSTFPNSYWTITSWSLGGSLFILLGLPLMEDIGVRLGYITFYIFFLLMVIPQALAQNFATLIITRFFTGGCVTLLANTMAGIIPDVWINERERSLPISLWILAYLLGSTLGPPMFAGVVQYTGDWRWIFYIQLIIYGAFFPMFAFVIVETRASVILRRRAKRLRKSSGKEVYAANELSVRSMITSLPAVFYRPLYLQLTEPVLVMSTLWSAFSFGTVFLFTQSVEYVFESAYGWSSYDTGYVIGAVAIGEVFGWVASFYSTHLYFESARSNKEFPGEPKPEARLYLSIFGSFFGMTAGMFVYAWTASPSITWVAPAIGLAMVGFGIQLVVSAVADYIEDAYAASGYAASAVSGIAAGENIVAGILPLAAQPMYQELGIHWASSLLGFIALVLSFAPVLFVWKGRQFRERSPFMQSGGHSFTHT